MQTDDQLEEQFVPSPIPSPKNRNGERISLEEWLSLSNEAQEKGIETNDIELTLKILEPYTEESLYHSSLHSIIIILVSALTLKKEDIEKANKSTEQTAKLSKKYRRTGFIDTIKKLFRTPNYDKYSDIELHAELIYAKFLGMSAILCGLEARNFYALIRIAYRLRLCVNAFKECRTILRTRTQWESETSRQHFEAGVRMANGIQHLAISHIPPRLLRLVNFLGYKGIESRAFEELNKTAFELPGIGSLIAQIVLLYYWVYVQPHGCLGPKDLTSAQHIIERELNKFPKSLLYRLPKAKIEQISGRIDEAINSFKECLIDNPVEISHKIFYIELSYSYALKCEWSEAIKYAELVRNQALHHSPAIVTYIEAIMRYAKSVDNNDEEEKQRASELFRSIPQMRVRYFGKTITIEKMAVEESLQYFRNNESLVLPEMGSMYCGNYLRFIKNNETLLKKHLTRVNKWIDFYSKDYQTNEFIDNYLTALFFRAVLLKLMGNFTEAKQCLNTILKEESRFEYEFSIPPQCVLELGLIEMEQNNAEEAKVWLKKAIKEYTGYLSENFVHIRAYAGLRELGVVTDKHEDPNKIANGKDWLKELEVDEDNYEDILKTDKLVLK